MKRWLIVRDVSNIIGGAGLAFLLCDRLGLAVLMVWLAALIARLASQIESSTYSTEEKP